MDHQFKPPALKRPLERIKQTQQEKTMSYQYFLTRDPSQQTILLDVSRAKLLLYCFEAPYLDTPEALTKFCRQPSRRL